MNAQAQLLLGELDATLVKAPQARHVDMLRQLTDLFMAGSPSYSPEQVSLFSAVFDRLTRGLAPRALVEFSGRLVAFDCAPADVVARLSSEDDIAVAGPVLEKSNVLSDGTLVDIATTKSQGHLMAIAGRARANRPVIDVLVQRGDPAMKSKVAGNEGALFTETGFARLVTEARQDKELAVLVAAREDIPEELKPFFDMALAG